jgi:hypothetical protein
MITFDQVRKRYPRGTAALGRLSIDAPPGQVTVLIGTSGGSKATALRMVDCRSYGLRATPQNSSTSAGSPPSGRRSGRQCEHDTTPGSSSSSPSKNRVICSGVRKVIDGVPTWFQWATACSMAAPWTALVEWLMARKLPGASAATRCPTISCACPVSEMWCKMPSSISATGLVKSRVRAAWAKILPGSRRSPSTQQYPPLEHATLCARLGAGQLADADTAAQVAVDDLIDTAHAPGSAQIPDVLVEQAVAEEGHPAPAGIRELAAQAARGGASHRVLVPTGGWAWPLAGVWG